jgi:methionyl-tRNA synthetase
MTSIFVTTSIPYVNAAPHIGFALELVQADVLARSHRQRGRDVRLQTGTDEHAFKNVLAARAAGLSTQALVDSNAARFRALVGTLNVSADDFVRTTERRHARVVDWFWRRLAADDIVVRDYRGLYCVGCEDFLREEELIDGVCPDHLKAPVVTEERNLFFRLSAYQERIEALIANDTIRIVPPTKKAEVLAFIRRGLEDFSLTRAAERAGGWGLSVPDDASQVIYVWIDALINYVSGLEIDVDADAARFWTNTSKKVHVIGKNVWKFHAVYWPALLLSAGLPLPDTLCIHGFLTEGGRKISKSAGNGVDPTTYVDRLGIDAIRYALLASGPPGNDADFSLQRAEALYTADLANGLGNTLSRLTGLAVKAGLTSFAGVRSPIPTTVTDAIDDFRFDIALGAVFDDLRALDQDIARVRPWELLKSDEGRATLRNEVLPPWLQRLFDAGAWLEPFLPTTSAKILAVLSEAPLKPAPALFPRVT